MLSPKPWRDESQSLPELLEPGLCRLLPVGSGSLLLGNYEAELFFSSHTVDWLCRCLHGSWNIWYIHIFCISSHCNFIYLVFVAFGVWQPWIQKRVTDRERERERSDTPEIGRVMPVFVFQQNVRKADKDLNAQNWGSKSLQSSNMFEEDSQATRVGSRSKWLHD